MLKTVIINNLTQTIPAFGLMMVAVRTVYVAVCHLFIGRWSNFQYLQRDAQCLACMRVIGIQKYGVALNFQHRKRLHLTVWRPAFQLTTYFDTGRKLAFGNALHQCFIADAKRVFGWQLQAGLKTNFLSLQSRFQFGEQVSISAVQVRNGAFAIFHYSALLIGHLNAQRDCAIFFNFHKGSIELGAIIPINRLRFCCRPPGI